MSYGIEACALAVLRSSPEVAVPLSRLHGALVAETGAPIGPSGPLRERLRRRPDLFLIMEPRPGLWETDGWPSEVREEYRSALTKAGLEPEPRIVPRAPGLDSGEEGSEATLLRQIGTSLIDLWDATPDDPETRALIEDALSATSLAQGDLAELLSAPPDPEEPAPPLLLEVLDDEAEPCAMRGVDDHLRLLLQDTAEDEVSGSRAAPGGGERGVEGGEERDQHAAEDIGDDQIEAAGAE